MNRLFLTIVILLLSFRVFSQTSINKDNLIGRWISDKESTQLLFYKDTKDMLCLQEIDTIGKQTNNVIKLRVDKNSIFVRIILIPNNIEIENRFILINNTTLKRIITGEKMDYEVVVIYKITK